MNLFEDLPLLFTRNSGRGHQMPLLPDLACSPASCLRGESCAAATVRSTNKRLCHRQSRAWNSVDLLAGFDFSSGLRVLGQERNPALAAKAGRKRFGNGWNRAGVGRHWHAGLRDSSGHHRGAGGQAGPKAQRKKDVNACGTL